METDKTLTQAAPDALDDVIARYGFGDHLEPGAREALIRDLTPHQRREVARRLENAANANANTNTTTN